MVDARWSFYAAELTTGRVVTELPLSNVQAQRRLNEGGSLSADLVLRGLDRNRRRDLLNATEEAKYSVVAARDGRVMGEWIIWKSQADGLGDSPIQIQGSELPSYLALRPMPSRVYTRIDQTGMAYDLLNIAFNGVTSPRRSVAVALDAPPSGVLRDRTYIYADGSVLQRISELAQVANGFEFWVESVFDWSSGYRSVARTFHVAYPRAGRFRELVFDQAPPTWRDRGFLDRSGGSIVALQLTNDGTRLGDESIAVCSGKGDGRVIGRATSSFLPDHGWPALTQMHSWQSVSVQATADAHASALLSVSQSPEVPPQVTVLADADPGLGDYDLGDTVRIKVTETTNLPGGWDKRVRVIGWTMRPPQDGPETVELEVTSIDVDPTIEGD